MNLKAFANFLCLAALATAALPAHAEWITRVTDGIMGTRITVELWSEDKASAEAAIDAVLDEMRHIDESMSTYKPTSEVSQVNAKAADGPMPITKELFDLLTTAKEYSVLTEGAFDITYASVGYLYDFRKRVRPNEAQITKALPAVDYRHVLLDPKKQTVQFSQKGVRVDLGLKAAATIELVGAAQADDGYLDSYFQVVAPDRRWTDIPHGHELYCAGHLIQPAVAF